MVCFNNLKNIGLALELYHAEHGSFPPAYTVDENGRRLHSWRTLLLPYLDEARFYETIDLSKPWDDPVNAKAYKAHFRVFQCPSADVPDNYTTYLGLVGEMHAFQPTERRTKEDFTDGLDQTVMVIDVEAKDAVHWMSPHDTDGDYLLELGKKSKLSHQSGISVVFADGRATIVEKNTPQDQLHGLSTIANADARYED